jgi:hypothetical protein
VKATTFDNSDGLGDAQYLQWLHDYPTGFVLNTRRWIDPTYMVLHKSACRSIGRPTAQMGSSPFTGRSYIKVCSLDAEALLAWMKQHGGTGFTRRCPLCQP